jgi:hypothetical protein
MSFLEWLKPFSNISSKLVVTGITGKQLKFYRPDIEEIYSDMVIIYDTTNRYKNEYGINHRFEFVYTDQNDKMIYKSAEINNFLRYVYKTNNRQDELSALDSMKIDLSMDKNQACKVDNQSLRKKESSETYNKTNSKYVITDSLSNDSDFMLIEPGRSVYTLGEYYVFDNKLQVIYELGRDKKLKASLRLEDYIDKISPGIEKEWLKHRYKGRYHIINFHNFVKGSNPVEAVISIYDSSAFYMSNGDTVYYPVYKHLICNVNGSLENIREFNIPDRFILFGAEDIVYSKGRYIYTVFDRKYHHTRHEQVKDSSFLLISSNKDGKAYEPILTYREAESKSQKTFSVYFESYLYNSGDSVFIVNPANGLFELYNKDFKTFLKPYGKLKSYIDSTNLGNKFRYLEGEPFDRRSKWIYKDFCSCGEYCYILLEEYKDDYTDTYSAIVVQKYDRDGNFQEETAIETNNKINYAEFLAGQTGLSVMISNDDDTRFYRML